MTEKNKKSKKQTEEIGTEATEPMLLENTQKSKNIIDITKIIIVLYPKGTILCQAVEKNLLKQPEMTASGELSLTKK